MEVDPIFQRVFKKLYGKPCWGVKHIYGGIISFEFGRPRLEVHEPQRISPKASRRVCEFFAGRRVHIKGEWTLLVWCCNWEIFRRGSRMGTSRMRSNLERVALSLDGQKLVDFSVEPQKVRSIFKFDLGGKLVTTSYNREEDLWMVYEPSGKILTLRGDSRYLYSTSYHTPPNTVDFGTLNWPSSAV
jgi:hypothetical protein